MLNPYIYKRTAHLVCSACLRLVSFRVRPIFVISRRFLFARGRFLSLWCETADFCPDARVEREACVQLSYVRLG